MRLLLPARQSEAAWLAALAGRIFDRAPQQKRDSFGRPRSSVEGSE